MKRAKINSKRGVRQCCGSGSENTQKLILYPQLWCERSKILRTKELTKHLWKMGWGGDAARCSTDLSQLPHQKIVVVLSQRFFKLTMFFFPFERSKQKQEEELKLLCEVYRTAAIGNLRKAEFWRNMSINYNFVPDVLPQGLLELSRLSSADYQPNLGNIPESLFDLLVVLLVNQIFTTRYFSMFHGDQES